MRVLGVALSIMLAAITMFTAAPAWANHPVIVEGNCPGPGVGAMATGLQTSPVPPGTCGDYDGDGRIGAAEDADMDNTYGTISAAVTAVANNGRVMIVRSGTFPEAIRLTPTEGASIVLAAAPGVDAVVDAVVQGQPGNADRQKLTGIFVQACTACRVAVRNLTVRNWNDGIRLVGHSRALIDTVRAEGNLNFGVRASDSSRVTIRDSSIDATGYRKDATGANKPTHGMGLRLHRDALGSVYDTTISNSFAEGISAPRYRITLRDVQTFQNRPNIRLYS